MPMPKLCFFSSGQVRHSCLLSQRLSAVILRHRGAGDCAPSGVWIRHFWDQAGQPPHKGFTQVQKSQPVCTTSGLKVVFSHSNSSLFWQSGRSGSPPGLEGSCEECVRHKGVQPRPSGAGGREVDCCGGREAWGGEKDIKYLRNGEVGWLCVCVCMRVVVGGGVNSILRTCFQMIIEQL